MKTFYISTIFIFMLFTGQAQITKHNWMVGGNALFSSQTQKLGSLNAKGINIKLAPNVGYFFIDKFAGGIKGGLSYSQLKYNGVKINTTRFDVGPFLRYYFLNIDNKINLLAEGCYQYSHTSATNNASNNENAITFSAGPVIYFNSSIGIEFTLNYQHLNSTDAYVNAIYFGIGFQIHLEREKN